MTHLNWIIAIIPVLIVLIMGFLKPAFAMKLRPKMESWLNKKKEVHKQNKETYSWWKKSFYPIYLTFDWLSKTINKFVKSEHWATGLYYGLSLLLAGFILILFFAIIYIAIVLVVTVILVTIMLVFTWEIIKSLNNGHSTSSGFGSAFSSTYKKLAGNPFMRNNSRQSYVKNDFVGDEYIEDDQGNRTYAREDFAGNEYLVENNGTKWRKGEDMNGMEFFTDDDGTKWYKTKDLTGIEYWKDYNSGRSVRVTEDYFGDKKFVED